MKKPSRVRFSNIPTDALLDGDVFLLGAGFSRAIGKNMPLMTGLTDAILATLADDPTNEALTDLVHFNPHFEHALSYLSESQPWLDESDRLRNRALFLDLTDTIQKVIVCAQNAAVSESPVCPGWLLQLALWMQRKRASIVTLNYDTLLESAFLELCVPNHPRFNSWDFRSFTVLPEASYLGSPEDPGVTLLKLHGSVHWTYSGTDRYFGESLRDGTVKRWSAALNDYTPFAMEEGRVPLIVPPTFNKNRYFENEKIRHLWRRAWLAFAGARRIFCIGYGMPGGDLLMQSLLSDAARIREFEAPFYVIDRSADAAERYRRAIPAPFIVRDTFVSDTDDATERFVRALLAGELEPQDKYQPASAVTTMRCRIQKRCTSRSTERNVVTEVPFRIERIDEYGIVLSDTEIAGTRYVVWEVLTELLQRIRSREFDRYLMPDDGYPNRIPFSGDAILFSLMRLAELVRERVENNQLQFLVL